MDIIPAPSSAAPAAPQAPPRAGPRQAPEGPAGATEDEQPNVSPQEQAQYEKVVSYALEHLTGEGGHKMIERIRAEPDDPAAALGKAVALLGDGVMQRATEGGEQIDDGVMMHAAAEIIAAAAEMAEAAGAIPAVTDEFLEQSLYHAMRTFGTRLLESGQQSPEETQQLSEALKQMGVDPGQQQQPTQPPAQPPMIPPGG